MAFSQRVTRLSRAARTTALDAIAWRAQLEMLMPIEFATSRIAMLEDRIRQSEDPEAMLRKLVMIMSSQIEARGQESASRVAAGGRQLATRTRCLLSTSDAEDELPRSNPALRYDISLNR